jgi:DNA polymerase III epsilon subunit family exonuclease
MELLERPLHSVPLVFFDVETTGLSSRRDRVCEIAIVRREPDGTESLYEALIDPQRPISRGAFEVNRITPEMLRGAPRFAQIAAQIAPLFENALGIAHNAKFDLGFLRQEFLLLGKCFPAPKCLDTLLLARGFYQFPKNSLGEVARNLGVSVSVAHRARADVDTTRAVFDIMRENLSTQGLLTANQIQAQLKRAQRQKRRRVDPLAPEEEVAL